MGLEAAVEVLEAAPTAILLVHLALAAVALRQKSLDCSYSLPLLAIGSLNGSRTPFIPLLLVYTARKCPI